MAITTNNSTRVNPGRNHLRSFFCLLNQITSMRGIRTLDARTESRRSERIHERAKTSFTKGTSEQSNERTSKCLCEESNERIHTRRGNERKRTRRNERNRTEQTSSLLELFLQTSTKHTNVWHD